MNKINAKIVADSINAEGKRITSFILTYPRFIHSELMTHRVFSRNSASSRAIPFNKMIEMVESDPFIPIAWQSKHTGMQGTDYLDGDSEQQLLINKWLEARDLAVQQAKLLDYNNVTKQLCNRLLEPYMWHTVLVTATEFENFFNLRCPKYGEGEFKSKKDVIRESKLAGMPSDYYSRFEVVDWLKHNYSQAEIHIQALAESMWDAMNESTPKQLQPGEWHIPFGDQMDITTKSKIVTQENNKIIKKYEDSNSGGLSTFCLPTIDLRSLIPPLKIKVATARCARLSYMTFEGEINYEKDIALHDQLLASHHASPFEHCCRVLTEEEYNTLGKIVLHHENEYIFEKGWVDNFKGFISYRRILKF